MNFTCVRVGKGMNYWYSTSVDTNIAESVHAQSQRDGVKLTLVIAVKKSERLDSLMFSLEQAAMSGGISAIWQ